MPKITNHLWNYGEKSAIAKKAGVQESLITRLLLRDCTVSLATAAKLTEACQQLRIDIRLSDWAYNKVTTNKYFGRRKQ